MLRIRRDAQSQLREVLRLACLTPEALGGLAGIELRLPLVHFGAGGGRPSQERFAAGAARGNFRRLLAKLGHCLPWHPESRLCCCPHRQGAENSPNSATSSVTATLGLCLLTAAPRYSAEIIPDLPQLENHYPLPPQQQGSQPPRTAQAIEALLEEWRGIVQNPEIPLEQVNRRRTWRPGPPAS